MSPLRVADLTVDHAHHALGVDELAPRLGWTLHADQPGQQQTAYHVLVASSVEALAADQPDVWDSGVIRHTRPGARYAGPALRSRARYWWRVRVFDRTGQPSAWSPVDWWEMGLLEPTDWSAVWIGRLAPSTRASVRQIRLGQPTRLQPGHTLGQSFTAEAPFASLSIHLTSDSASEAECVLALRRAGPSGEEVQRKLVTLRPGPGDYFSQWLAADEAWPPGAYYVEVSGAATDACWWTDPDAHLPGGHAFADAQVVAGARTLVVDPPPVPSPLLRKRFQLPASVASARLYATGLGYHELFLNGRRVGERLLTPATTNYDRRVLYTCYDVTALLRAGSNVVAAVLGHGFYRVQVANVWGWNAAPWSDDPKLLCQLEVRCTDGSQVVVTSDATWRTLDGPTRRACVYGGETYDARREPPGWMHPDFDDTAWLPAEVRTPPAGRLCVERVPPVLVAESSPPLPRATLADGSRVYDLGYVTAGWAQVETVGPPGAELTLRYGEKLRPDQHVLAENRLVGGPVQTDRYVRSGTGRESWEPRFSYKGFRYVEVSSSLATTDEVVRARSVHTSVEPAGTFGCSDALFAWLHEATGRTILNNLHGIPTDTPLFEKNGWTADAHLIAEAAIHQFDMHLFFRKWLRDLKDAQADDGAIPVVVPTPGWGTTADPCWSTAYLLIAWNLFEYYADADLLDEHYTAFRTYVDHLHATCRPTGWIWPKFSYADWLAPGHKFAPEGPRLAASAFVYLATRRLADIAEVLQHHDAAARYAHTAGEIGLAFNRAFFDAASATYRSAPGEAYRQTSNVLPLAFGLVPADAIPAVVQHLVHDIVDVRDGHLNTGALGAKYLLPVLTEHGRADVAVTVASQRTYPSWGYWKEQGSRTLWEAWDPNARSHDHYFLGSVDRWLCEHVAGLRPSGPGFETIQVKPLVDQRITAASERYRSVRGEIAVAWQRSSAGLELDLTLPVGATALVHVPAGEGDLVTEAGRPIDASPSRGYASVSVASGAYHFRSTPGAARGSPVA